VKIKDEIVGFLNEFTGKNRVVPNIMETTTPLRLWIMAVPKEFKLRDQ
jgi:hypothetical protein